jgi:hypothetical protein
MKQKLDLHGIKHTEADKIIEDFVLTNKIPMSIVTGNSYHMKKIATSVLDRHGYKWMIMAANLGEIIVTG